MSNTTDDIGNLLTVLDTPRSAVPVGACADVHGYLLDRIAASLPIDPGMVADFVRMCLGG